MKVTLTSVEIFLEGESGISILVDNLEYHYQVKIQNNIVSGKNIYTLNYGKEFYNTFHFNVEICKKLSSILVEIYNGKKIILPIYLGDFDV